MPIRLQCIIFTKHHSTETLLVSLYNKLVSTVSHQEVSRFAYHRHLCCICHYRSYHPHPATFLLVRRIWHCSLYSGSNLICPLDPSLLKRAATHLNPSHSPVVSLKAPSWAHSFSSFSSTPLSHLIESSSVDHHLYADDTQLFISFPRPLFPPQSRSFSLWLTKSLSECHATSFVSTLPKQNSS